MIEDAEAQAAAWIGKRVTLTRTVLGGAGALCGVPIYLVTYALLRGSQTDAGESHVVAALSSMAAAVPVLIAIVTSKAAVSVLLPRWVSAAARRFEIDERDLHALNAMLK